jgi:hypothetical protein
MPELEAAIQRLVGICPEFQPSWREYLASWERKPAGEYNQIGSLARWVVDRMAAQQVECFPALFGEVETMLDGASEDLRAVLVIGLLEDIQYVSTDRGVDPDIALSFLGPESRKSWFELIRQLHGPERGGWVGQKLDEHS